MTHREPKTADLVGKTIAAVDTRAVNILRLRSTDGSAIAFEVESMGCAGGGPIYGIAVCDDCAEDFEADEAWQ